MLPRVGNHSNCNVLNLKSYYKQNKHFILTSETMDVIKEINEKYLALEAEVDNKLEKVKREEIKFEKTNAACLEKSQQKENPKILTYEEAMTRNVNLLKSLEMAKARLRSRSTFSPVEQILEKTLRNYKMDLEQSQMMENSNRHHYSTENIYDTVP